MLSAVTRNSSNYNLLFTYKSLSLNSLYYVSQCVRLEPFSHTIAFLPKLTKTCEKTNKKKKIKHLIGRFFLRGMKNSLYPSIATQRRIPGREKRAAGKHGCTVRLNPRSDRVGVRTCGTVSRPGWENRVREEPRGFGGDAAPAGAGPAPGQRRRPRRDQREKLIDLIKIPRGIVCRAGISVGSGTSLPVPPLRQQHTTYHTGAA